MQFSPGDFRSMAVQTKKPKAAATEESISESQEEAASNLYSCPQDGCVKVFQRSVMSNSYIFY